VRGETSKKREKEGEKETFIPLRASGRGKKGSQKKRKIYPGRKNTSFPPNLSSN